MSAHIYTCKKFCFKNSTYYTILVENLLGMNTFGTRCPRWHCRCSSSFFAEERAALQRRRQKLRLLQQRKAAKVTEVKDLPEEIPLPLVIGTHVTGERGNLSLVVYANKVFPESYRPTRQQWSPVLLALSWTPTHSARPCLVHHVICPFPPQLSLILIINWPWRDDTMNWRWYTVAAGETETLYLCDHKSGAVPHSHHFTIVDTPIFIAVVVCKNSALCKLFWAFLRSSSFCCHCLLILARLRKPHDGLFSGIIDALDTVTNTYRITFDRAGFGTYSVPDIDVVVCISFTLAD